MPPEAQQMQQHLKLNGGDLPAGDEDRPWLSALGKFRTAISTPLY
jgi:hypothetical protein